MSNEAKKLSVKPSQDELHFLLESGYLCRDLDRHQEAADIFQGAAALLPDDPLPVAALGGVLLASGQADAAVGCLEKGLADFPGDPFLKAHLAEALLCRKELPRAEELFHQAQAADPQGPAGQMARSYLEMIKELKAR